MPRGARGPRPRRDGGLLLRRRSLQPPRDGLEGRHRPGLASRRRVARRPEGPRLGCPCPGGLLLRERTETRQRLHRRHRRRLGPHRPRRARLRQGPRHRRHLPRRRHPVPSSTDGPGRPHQRRDPHRVFAAQSSPTERQVCPRRAAHSRRGDRPRRRRQGATSPPHRRRCHTRLRIGFQGQGERPRRSRRRRRRLTHPDI
mmetsp:Transcript_19195/g.60366  ORF Transcript_19195/g.60366 Transcript_19195/m.60366 type:complete len:200 (+) Transcript_19195:710-1309(+)